MARVDPARAGLTVRCAIYTRKSSDEGLEQEFNSLDAQREACEAYIVSQRHAGWVALANMYDDGGLSGGTMERPALKRLLEDIKASKVQIVVVYKVDRLTRSLADFAKIVDIFDAHNASFVSVTQRFNTTTSMGRLTLNMLLSFAQPMPEPPTAYYDPPPPVYHAPRRRSSQMPWQWHDPNPSPEALPETREWVEPQ
jgi:site-specific DNA recombinase